MALRVEVEVQCVSERRPKRYANVLAIGLSEAARWIATLQQIDSIRPRGNAL